MKITLKQANILHNIVKYPATAISYVLQVLAITLYNLAQVFIFLSNEWGQFIVRHSTIKKQ